MLALAAVLLMVGCSAQPTPAPMAVGAGTSPESALVGQLYAAALRYYGTAAEVTPTKEALGALDSGSVTVLPGHGGPSSRSTALAAPAGQLSARSRPTNVLGCGWLR